MAVTTKSTTTVSTKKRNYRKKKNVVPKATKKYVKAAIHKQIENKTQQYIGNLNLTNYADSTSMNAIPLTPYSGGISIMQGDGQSDRSANKIKIMKLSIHFMITPNPYNGLLNPAPKPLLIRVFIGYAKSNPVVTPTDFTNFYQIGNTSTAPTNFITDMFRPVNKDKFVCKSILLKLGCAEYSGSGFSAGAQYFANNDFKFNIYKKISLTKYINKTVIYNDTTAIPTTRGLFMWYQVVAADNTIVSGAIQGQLNYVLNCEYEDA